MRPRSPRLLLPLLLLVLAAPAGAARPTPPEPVAPGDPARLAAAEPCPTFHWGGDASARAFELAVFGLAESGETAGEPAGSLPRVFRELLPGSARGWTPPLDRCLQPGRYGWAIRARGPGEPGPWSEPRFFEVAPAPTAEEVARAVAVLERYLAAGESVEALAAARDEGGPEAPAARAGGAAEPASPSLDPRLLAAPDVTAFRAAAAPTTGVTFGAHGTSKSTGAGSAGVVGHSTAASGDVAGVYGQVASAGGAAGVFDNTGGGDLLRGLASGVELFTVEGDGGVVAASFTGDGSGLTGVVADSAAAADHATTADSATTAGHATTADSATTADHATTADSATSTGSASDLACAGCVSPANLDFDPATQGELDAHAVSGDHDGRYVDAAGDSMTGDLDVGADVTAERIGIGTTDPSTLLDVTGGDAVIQGAPDTRLASIHDGSADAIAGFSATGPGSDTGASGGFILAAAKGPNKHMSGIGDNDPYLHIRSTLQDFHVGQLDPYVTVTGDTGRVGVGTTDPDEALEVAGNVLATGFLGDGSGLTGVAADTAASADHATTADSATTADHATTAGSAATAAQLAADGADCAAGEAAVGVDSAGAAQGCFDVATQAELDAVDTHSHSGEVVNSYRIQVYGHAGHSAFSINSTDYVSVPGTFSAIDSPFPAPEAGTTRMWRVEVSFAVNHDRVITLRLQDPANAITRWEHSFTGGHAPNIWWSWRRTAQFSLDAMAVQGWKRQNELQMKSSDTDTAYLGSVWVVAEDVEN